jgi:molybdopterin biosynthesis enzyme
MALYKPPFEHVLETLRADLSAAPETEELAPENALGCLLAADVLVPADFPPHRVAAMDGMAVAPGTEGPARPAAMPAGMRGCAPREALRTTPSRPPRKPGTEGPAGPAAMTAGGLRCAPCKAQPTTPSRPRRKPGTEGAQIRPVRTGEAVGEEVAFVLMEESFDPSSVEKLLREPPVEKHIVERGGEYRRGEVLASRGSLVGPALVSQARLLGIAALPTLRPLRVEVVLVGSAGTGEAALLWLTTSLEGRFSVAVSVVRLEGTEGLDGLVPGDADLVILLSDGAPGRYRALRAFHESGRAGFEPVFWKVDLHPCKHVGYGRFHGVPTFFFPDNLYKVAISAAAFLPHAVAFALGLDDPLGPALRLASQPVLPALRPWVCPVRRQGDGSYRPLPVDAQFSGREVVGLDGLAVFCGEGTEARLLAFTLPPTRRGP